MSRFKFIIEGMANANDYCELVSWLEGKFKDKEGDFQVVNIQEIFVKEI